MKECAALVSLLALAGCSGGGGEPTTPPPVTVASVTVTPASPSVVIGATVQLTATIKDGNGTTLAGRSVTWSSSSQAVAAVSASGLVTSAGIGSAEIRATSEGVTGRTTVTVTPVAVASLTLSANAATLVPGEPLTLAATPRDSDGNPLTGRAVAWNSSAQSVAAVNQEGVVTAAAVGNAVITATTEGKSAQAAITVRDGGFVGSEGGTIVAAGGAVTIVVPAGAVGAGSALTVTLVPNPPVHANLIPGTAYSLGPDGTIFDVPVTVRINYQAGQVPGGSNQDRFAVHRFTSGAWELLGDRAIDVPNRSVSGEAPGFSIFAIIELPGNPVPVLNALDPSGAMAGGPGFVLTLTGGDFVDGALVQWNGSPRPTTFISSGEIEAAIPEEDIAAAGQAQVTIVNPPPDGGSSASLPFTIQQPPAAPGVLSVSAGDEHTCGVTVTGQGFCWGMGQLGQLGNGSFPDAVTPVAVVGGHQFASVSAAGTHTCGLTTGGTILCWGSGNGGRLGTGASLDVITPVQIASALNWSALTSSGAHTCGLTMSGAAHCWGLGLDGQLGDGTGAAVRNAPIPVVGGHTFGSISAGLQHTCALNASGAAWCWGLNGSGQLGTGTTSGSSAPVSVSGGLLFARIAAGGTHTCGLTPAGAAYCWGLNNVGQLGDGSGIDRSSPVAVAGGMTFQSIATGRSHTCGLTTAGAAHCWGAGFAGQLGHGFFGNQITSAVPVAVVGGHVFGSIEAGDDHSCAITTTGAGYCWGANPEGRLGNGSAPERATPLAIANNPSLGMISGGGRHGCGVTTDGMALCWGERIHGQLGDGLSTIAYTPAAIAGGLSFSAIAAAVNHGCGVAIGGAAYCWGDGEHGRLGQGSTASAVAPAAVAGGLSFASVTAGTEHSCGLTTTGSAYCWGNGSSGQLGNGSAGSSSVPVAVTGGHTFVMLDAGHMHNCGVTTGGAAYCWGTGTDGQLGNGSGFSSATPVAVTGGHSFMDIAAGNRHSCGVTTSGAALCWGLAAGGRLGNGTEVAGTASPVAVLGGHVFALIAAGGLGNFAHTCGITTTGAGYCWGRGDFGQLGMGSSATSRSAPVAVAGQHSFAGISVGVTHSCGITTAGMTYCWGEGTGGRLGNASPNSRSSPVAVGPWPP